MLSQEAEDIFNQAVVSDEKPRNGCTHTIAESRRRVKIGMINGLIGRKDGLRGWQSLGAKCLAITPYERQMLKDEYNEKLAEQKKKTSKKVSKKVPKKVPKKVKVNPKANDVSYFLNPYSGRYIRVGGAIYEKLKNM
jgi:hypothetical protein